MFYSLFSVWSNEHQCDCVELSCHQPSTCFLDMNCLLTTIIGLICLFGLVLYDTFLIFIGSNIMHMDTSFFSNMFCYILL